MEDLDQLVAVHPEKPKLVGLCGEARSADVLSHLSARGLADGVQSGREREQISYGNRHKLAALSPARSEKAALGVEEALLIADMAESTLALGAVLSVEEERGAIPSNPGGHLQSIPGPIPDLYPKPGSFSPCYGCKNMTDTLGGFDH